MNSRDRINLVLNGKIPDRVPVTLFILDEGHFLKQVYPDIALNDYINNNLKVIDIQRNLGADIHLRLWKGCMPVWMFGGGFNTETTTDTWMLQKEITKTTESEKTISKVKTPAGSLSQEFTIAEIGPGTFHYACTKKPVNDTKDLEILENFEPPISEEYQGNLNNIVSKVKDYLGNDGVISMWVSGGVFNQASHFIDINTLYMIFLTDNDFYNRLMEFCLNRLKPYINAAEKAGVDIINVGGNVAGGFLGRNVFEKYIMPYEKSLIEYIKNQGLKTLYHNCGQIMELLEPYKEMGPDIIEPFAPPPSLGDGNLEKAKEMSEGMFTIIGNLDQVNVLQKGSLELIEEKVKEACLFGKPGGRFILQPSDFLEYGTPVENVSHYVKAGKKYGIY